MILGLGNTIPSDSVRQGLGGGGGGFDNTYSLAFDGVDDIVESTFTGNINSLSLWFKPNSVITTTSSKMVLVSFTDVFPRAGIYLGSSFGALSNELISIGSNTASRISYYAQAGGTISADWHHLAISHTGTQYNIYLDNVNVFTGNIYNEDVSIITASRFDIGARILSGSPDSVFDGNIDEVSVFNYELTSGNVASIYNSGVPNNLDDLTTPPVVWYRNGDNSSYKSTQWLIPENSNKDKVSNYSFDFDGVNDYIKLSSPMSTSGTNYSISCWFKSSQSGGNRIFVGQSGSKFFGINFGKLTFYSSDNSYDMTSTNSMNDGNWHHVIYTYNYTSGAWKSYIDGVIDDDQIATAGVNIPSWNFFGARNSGQYFANCNLDEISYFETELSASDVTAIYNSGQPTDLTSYSPKGWWKMGEEATFSANWVVPDQVGSNDGTSSNMTIEDRVGDAPNSNNNALSYNMTESDRETDVPT